MKFSLRSHWFLCCLASLQAVSTASGAITETFDSYSSGGSGWVGNWARSSGGEPSAPTATATVATADPLNGGGSYISVSTNVNKPDIGIRRNMGTAVSSQAYTLTFDWRLDSADNLNDYLDRIHIGASTSTAFGTSVDWTWMVGVVGADQSPANTFYAGQWYFYDNSEAAGTTGGFTIGNMVNTGIFLAQDVTYSFLVNVDPATKTYSVTMNGSDGSSFSRSGMDFRNQGATSNNAANLFFGTANTHTAEGEERVYSVDNITIIPEPSAAALVALGGVALLRRTRRD